MTTKSMLAMAEKDADAARTLCAIDCDRYAEVIAFHSQQAAEKMIKQAMTDSGLFYEQTHKIRELLMPLCAELNIKASGDVIEAAGRLTIHAVNTRYVAAANVGEAEAKAAMADCDTIADFLEPYGFDVVRVGRGPRCEESCEDEVIAEATAQPNLKEAADQVTMACAEINSADSTS